MTRLTQELEKMRHECDALRVNVHRLEKERIEAVHAAAEGREVRWDINVRCQIMTCCITVVPYRRTYDITSYLGIAH